MREMVAAAAAAFLAALAGCLAAGRLFRPVGRKRRWLLIPGRGDGEGLEQAVREAARLSEFGCVPVIADVGLSPEGRALALRLARRWPELVLWPGACLNELLDEGWESPLS